MKVDFSNYLFHASSWGNLMIGSKTGETMGETCKKYLMQCYVEAKYGRKKDFTNKYIEKGLAVEEDSITLYSRVKKKFYKKNDQRLSNAYLTGEPDSFEGDSILKAVTIIDVKSSWDIHTFYAVLGVGLNKIYEYQLQGYMALSGAKEAKLVYCLVDTPDPLINDAKRKLQWQMGVIDPDANPDYQEACLQIEKEMIFTDIPIEERYIEFTLHRDDKKILEGYEQVKFCREFLNKLP
jgi:hypothetical protein